MLHLSRIVVNEDNTEVNLTVTYDRDGVTIARQVDEEVTQMKFTVLESYELKDMIRLADRAHIANNPQG